MNKLTKSILEFALYIVTTFYYAFIFKCLWGWYIIPWINNVPPLPYVVAIGIMIIIKFLTYQITINDSIYFHNLFRIKKEDIVTTQKEVSALKLTRTFTIIIINTAFLISGWFFQFFM